MTKMSTNYSLIVLWYKKYDVIIRLEYNWSNIHLGTFICVWFWPCIREFRNLSHTTIGDQPWVSHVRHYDQTLTRIPCSLINHQCWNRHNSGSGNYPAHRVGFWVERDEVFVMTRPPLICPLSWEKNHTRSLPQALRWIPRAPDYSTFSESHSSNEIEQNRSTQRIT